MVARMAEAGQSCGEPLHKEEEGHPHQDVFGRDLTHGDQPLADGTMVLVIRTPPRTRLDDFWSRWQCAGLVWHVDRLQEPQRGQRLAYWMLIMPKKGQRLPYRGLTSPFSAHFWHF
jgi:hypothetical protein